MTLLTNKSGMSNCSSPSKYSQEWRSREAKEIFSLLQHEYLNSKRLSIMKRYKELERIIKMFTSEPVLVKLRWLSSSDVESLATLTCETDSEADRENEDGQDLSMSGSDWHKERQSQNSVDKFLDGLKNIVSSRVKATPFANAFNFSKPTTPSPSAISIDLDSSSRCFSLDQDSTYSPSVYPSSPVGGVNTPTTPASSSSNCCFLFTCSNTSISDDGTYFVFSSSNVESTHRKSSDEKYANVDRVSLRSRGIENCVIKRNEIPQFQIPPKRVSSARKLSVNIDHSLYRTSSPRTLAGSRHGLKISHSSPNITDNSRGLLFRRLFKGDIRRKHCCPDIYLQRANTDDKNQNARKDADYLTGFPTGDLPLNTSSSEEDSFFLETSPSFQSIVKAHESLTNMKSEFERLDDKNFFVRYRKMKTMIKSCMTLQF